MPLAVSNAFGAAIVAGASAIVGGLIGGLITGRVTLQAEDKRQDFARQLEKNQQEEEARRESSVVRGVARAVQAKLLHVHNHCTNCLVNESWWPRHLQPEAAIALEDRKLLASKLDPDRWGSVLFGDLVWADLNVRFQMSAQVDPEADPPDFVPGDEEIIATAAGALAAAALALVDLAEMPAEDIETALGLRAAEDDVASESETHEPGVDD
jgi:hypothetical protein